MESVIGFYRAVRVGSCISVGGTAPVNPEGETVSVGDPGDGGLDVIEYAPGSYVKMS